MGGTSQLQDNRGELKKSFSPLQVWSLALGCIIGWGCFILPGLNFLPKAGPIAACIGFAVGAFLLLFVILSFGKMIENYPVAGGEFAYAYAGFGTTAAFICGWALVLGYMSIIALNGTALALLSRFLIPGVLQFGHLYTIAGWDVYAGELMLVSGAILFFGIVNYRGVGMAGTVQVVLSLVLVAGLVLFCVGAFTAETATIANLQPYFAEDKSPIGAVAAIVALAPFLYVGFDTIPQAAEEFDFAPAKATRLMIIAIVIGAAMYAFVTLAVGIVIPYPELLAQGNVWDTGVIAEMTMGRTGSIILALAVLSAILTGINGFYLATSRLIFSMARAKFLPEWFSFVHKKNRSPSNAILFTIIMSLIAPWFGREALDWVVSMAAVGSTIAYAFTSLTAYRFMVTHPDVPGAKNGKIYAIIGSCASFFCLALLVVPGSPAAIRVESWYALIAWTLMGFVFYRSKAAELNNMSTSELSHLILGSRDKPVFFKSRGNCSEAATPATE